ncbi:MAG: superinfection immunity protein [Patescibacteria group bacterium]|nr:superinfection immunity protein [Patescibacteria group bacterium]
MIDVNRESWWSVLTTRDPLEPLMDRQLFIQGMCLCAAIIGVIAALFARSDVDSSFAILYFMPSVVASFSRQAFKVIALNLLAGWTIAGWGCGIGMGILY